MVTKKQSPSGAPPGRIVKEVVGSAALRMGIDGALLRIAHRRRERIRADRRLGAELNRVVGLWNHSAVLWVLAGNALKGWDGSARVTVARFAADGAAVGEPEARLSVAAGEVPVRIGRRCRCGGEGAPRLEGDLLKEKNQCKT